MAAKICGNCFSRLKNGRCPECGYTKNAALSDHDILPVGTVLNGRYVIGRLLGKGGFGISYLAYDKTDCKAVAVKEFYPEGTAVRTEDNVTCSLLFRLLQSFDVCSFCTGTFLLISDNNTPCIRSCLLFHMICKKIARNSKITFISKNNPVKFIIKLGGILTNNFYRLIHPI